MKYNTTLTAIVNLNFFDMKNDIYASIKNILFTDYLY